jgi:hypothetical protein
MRFRGADSLQLTAYSLGKREGDVAEGRGSRVQCSRVQSSRVQSSRVEVRGVEEEEFRVGQFGVGQLESGWGKPHPYRGSSETCGEDEVQKFRVLEFNSSKVRNSKGELRRNGCLLSQTGGFARCRWNIR